MKVFTHTRPLSYSEIVSREAKYLNARKSHFNWIVDVAPELTDGVVSRCLCRLWSGDEKLN
jgi:hypothetical protein